MRTMRVVVIRDYSNPDRPQEIAQIRLGDHGKAVITGATGWLHEHLERGVISWEGRPERVTVEDGERFLLAVCHEFEGQRVRAARVKD
ncbi:MAG TPA: hypothetical protein VH701_17370 [Vicinamibacterales bacterium]